MAVLTFPSITPDIQDFGVRYNTQVSTSAISGITQSVELPGARWSGSMSFRDLTNADAAALKAFLLELRGTAGRFYYGDLTHTSPFQNVSGALTIESASTPRFIRITYNSPTSEQFQPGDYIQIGTDTDRELKMVISNTQFSGDTYDVVVEPMIRRTDYVGQSVIYTNPTGVFLLNTDDQATWSARSKAQLQDISLEFLEAYV